MSDLHVSAFVPLEIIEDGVKLALREKPDLFVLTGDFVTNSAPFDEKRYARALKHLGRTAPTYACLGNHDGGSWCAGIGGFADTTVVRSLLQNSRVMLLHNRSAVIRVRGTGLNLVGTGDLWNHEVDAESAFSAIDSSLPVVLLAHNPDTKDVLGDRSWDVMLSGHTHGGQVMLLGVEKEFVPVKDKRYIAGLGEWRGRKLYVTRGVGSLGGIRLNCRPEVTVLELTPAAISNSL